jgi:RNA recognition motif-containing protein
MEGSGDYEVDATMQYEAEFDAQVLSMMQSLQLADDVSAASASAMYAVDRQTSRIVIPMDKALSNELRMMLGEEPVHIVPSDRDFDLNYEQKLQMHHVNMELTGFNDMKEPNREMNAEDEELANCRSIYLSGIPHSCSDVDVSIAFSKFGPISRIDITKPKKNVIRTGYIQFVGAYSADFAVKESGKFQVSGAALYIEKSLRFDFMEFNDSESSPEPSRDDERPPPMEFLPMKKAVPKLNVDSSDISEERTRGLFAGNVPFDCKVEEFVETFKRFGTVESYELPIFKQTGKLHGFGFILFSDFISVKKAMEQNGKLAIRKRVLMLEPSPSFERKIKSLSAASSAKYKFK